MIFHYVHPRIEIKSKTGGEFFLSYGKELSSESTGVPFSVNLQLNQKVEFSTHPKSSNHPQFNGNLQVVHYLGSTNEGERQSMLSSTQLKSVLGSMKYTGFKLNQVSAEINVSQALTKNVSSFSQLTYQGTPIGQQMKAITGVEVVNSKGMKVFGFAGYLKNDLKGFKTKSSLFTAPSGKMVGVGIESKSGVKIDFSQGQNGMGGVKAIVPVSKKKKD
jgi:hypothetical protein